MGASFCFSTGSSWRSCRNPPQQGPQKCPSRSQEDVGWCGKSSCPWREKVRAQEDRQAQQPPARLWVSETPGLTGGPRHQHPTPVSPSTSETPGYLLREGWLRMAAKEDMILMVSPGNRTDPLRNDGLLLPSQHQAGLGRSGHLTRFLGLMRSAGLLSDTPRPATPHPTRRGNRMGTQRTSGTLRTTKLEEASSASLASGSVLC